MEKLETLQYIADDKKLFSDDHYAIWHISHSFPLVKI
jgi:hypothetical protein